MTFTIRKASNTRYKAIKEINTLEELMVFKESCKQSIIITKAYDGSPVLEIYDEYRE